MNISVLTDDMGKYKRQVIHILSANDWQHFRSYSYIKTSFSGGNPNGDFRGNFLQFYRMNGPAGLNASQKELFFELLENKESDLSEILRQLHKLPGYNGRHRLFLSFGTKLLHTLNNALPIYDSNVANVLELTPQQQRRSPQERISNRIAIYVELQECSKNLLQDVGINNLLHEIRGSLIKKAKAESFEWRDELVSKEKFLDSVLWALYKARNGV